MDNRANPSTVSTSINLPFPLKPIHVDSTVSEEENRCENGVESSSGTMKKNCGEGSPYPDPCKQPNFHLKQTQSAHSIAQLIEKFCKLKRIFHCL